MPLWNLKKGSQFMGYTIQLEMSPAIICMATSSSELPKK